MGSITSHVSPSRWFLFRHTALRGRSPHIFRDIFCARLVVLHIWHVGLSPSPSTSSRQHRFGSTIIQQSRTKGDELLCIFSYVQLLFGHSAITGITFQDIDYLLKVAYQIISCLDQCEWVLLVRFFNGANDNETILSTRRSHARSLPALEKFLVGLFLSKDMSAERLTRVPSP